MQPAKPSPCEECDRTVHHQHGGGGTAAIGGRSWLAWAQPTLVLHDFVFCSCNRVVSGHYGNESTCGSNFGRHPQPRRRRRWGRRDHGVCFCAVHGELVRSVSQRGCVVNRIADGRDPELRLVSVWGRGIVDCHQRSPCVASIKRLRYSAAELLCLRLWLTRVLT